MRPSGLDSEMTRERIIIADFTREAARIGVTDSEAQAVVILDEFEFPLRAAVRQTATEVLAFAGDEARDIRRDAHTLVFNRLHDLLLRMEDVELQSYLTEALWRTLCNSLTQRGVIDAARPNIGYIIPPYLSSRPLLENIRSSCAEERRVRMAGFAHEAAALVVGFLRSALFKSSEVASHSNETTCLVVAYDEQDIDVICFDYAKESAIRHQVRVRDFFRVSQTELSDRFARSDWLNSLSRLISVEATSMSGEAGRDLMKILKPFTGSASQHRYRTGGAHKLKIKGAAYIAQCCLGRGRAADEYVVSTAYHVGVQLNREAFHPLLTKNEMARIDSYPHRCVQPFTIRGEPGEQLQLSLLCGYSDQMSEATLLGRATMSGQDLSAVMHKGDAILMTLLRFDAPGCGELVLGSLLDNKIIARQPFVLPGLVL